MLSIRNCRCIERIAIQDYPSPYKLISTSYRLHYLICNSNLTFLITIAMIQTSKMPKTMRKALTYLGTMCSKHTKQTQLGWKTSKEFKLYTLSLSIFLVLGGSNSSDKLLSKILSSLMLGYPTEGPSNITSIALDLPQSSGVQRKPQIFSIVV